MEREIAASSCIQIDQGGQSSKILDVEAHVLSAFGAEDIVPRQFDVVRSVVLVVSLSG
jgi:hypothetical protein